MVEQFAPAPINPVISIRPVSTAPAGQDATNVQTILAALPPGSTLEGFVIKRDPQNNPILRTPQGDLQIQSDVFVKTGSQMVIRVDMTSESRARIVTIDGMEPEIYATQNARGIAGDTIVPSQLLSRPAGAAPGTMPQAQQPTLQAMLLSPAQPGAVGNQAAGPQPLLAAMPQGSVVPPLLMKLQAGAALKVNLLALKLPSELIQNQTVNPAASQLLSQAPVPRQLLAQGNTPVQTPGQQPMEQANIASNQAAKAALPGSVVPPMPEMPVVPSTMQPTVSNPYVLAAQTQLPLPEGAAPPQNRPPLVTVKPSDTQAAPLPKDALPGIVIGHEADGGNVVQTHFGTLKIYTPAPLPVQTQLTLQVEPETQTAARPTIQPTIVTSEDAEALSNVSRGWPKLAELFSADASLARDTLLPVMPQVGHKLASGMLFFMAAVKGGDLSQWVGKRALAALEEKAPAIASRLKGDMAQLQQLFLHSPLDHWSGMTIPMVHQGAIEYARFYIRDEQSEAGQSGGGKGKDQRFVVEVDMSHLGEIQFDGFIRQGTAKKQFDLMVRTAKILPAGMENEIRTLFDTSIGATGYTGYLAFQQGPQHFVRPLAGARPDIPIAGDHTILA